MKSRDGQSQRREEKKKEDQKRESLRRKKIQARKKVGKSRNTVFFQWFVALEGQKVGSLKRRVRSQLARWEMKNCMPLWREALLQVKKLRTPHVRSTFWSCDVEKCTALWREAHFQVKMYKTHQVRTTFGCYDVERGRREVHFEVKMYKTPQLRSTFRSCNVEKVHAVVARSTLWSQNVQNTPCSDHFWKLRCRKSPRCCGEKHISKSKC